MTNLICTPDMVLQLVPGVGVDDLFKLFPLMLRVKIDVQEVKEVIRRKPTQ